MPDGNYRFWLQTPGAYAQRAESNSSLCMNTVQIKIDKGQIVLEPPTTAKNIRITRWTMNAVTFLTILTLSFARSVNAATIELDCANGGDRETIQQAIEAANPGDTILLKGTCYLDDGQPIFIDKSQLTLSGDPGGTTVVKGLGAAGS